MIKNIILATMLSTTALTAAAADVDNTNYFVQLNGGMAHGQAPRGDFSKGSMGNTGLFGFEAGVKLDENFRVSASLDYRPGYKNDHNGTDGAGAFDKSTIKVKSLVAMLNAYYDITKVEGFTPYVTFGLGMARNDAGQRVQHYPRQSGYPEYNFVLNGDKKTNFAWKAGLGTKYEINKEFDLDLRYQYADLGKFQSAKTATLNGNAISHDIEKGRLKSHEFLVGIAYKF